MRIERYGAKFWGLYDQQGDLVVVAVYKKGAREVARRLLNSSETGPLGVVSIISEPVPRKERTPSRRAAYTVNR